MCDDCAAHAADPMTAITSLPCLFTVEEVGQAADAAIALLDGLRPGTGLSERDRDLLTIAFHAATERLTDPAITLDAVIRKHFEDPPQMVRGWWTNWE